MCSKREMIDKIEKGKKLMTSVFTRFASSNTTPGQTPAFAGNVRMQSDQKSGSCAKKK